MLLLSLLLASLPYQVSGLALPQTMNKRIINGFLMPKTLGPYSVSVVRRKGNVLYMCGGSLISKQHVLTAAHCIVDGNAAADPSTVTIGYDSMDKDKQKKAVATKVTFNPSYLKDGKTDSRYDLAIIQVEPLTLSDNTQVIPIYGGSIVADQTIMAMGWGGTEPNAILRNLLRGVKVKTGTTKACQEFSGSFDNNNGPQVCTLGSLTPEKSTCGGDSGSSVVINYDGKVALVGANSIGVYIGSDTSCGSKNSAHFYVHPYYHIDFITKTTGLDKSKLVIGTGRTGKDASVSADENASATVTETVIVTPSLPSDIANLL
ncbi:hypothetical protein H4R20_003086 [Coemansia guatemalensis]|uniref:Peptidase S1 domain-containing protein n=1 Tax=Coemansia guatemalensis TaxID=2761395 RepID=A0A9W8HTY9_9FUNG|nr:hypothetical protein H4R20_003086 [Coemansia guatemalensis]